MNISTRTTQTQPQPQQETPIADLYNAIKAETDKHSLFITENIEDMLPLQLAGIEPVYIPPEDNAAAGLYSVLQGNKTNKTIIVCNVPETAQDWQTTIRELRENTYTDIDILPGKIRKAIEKINRDLQPGNTGSEKTGQYIKALETYAAQVEERANPKPGNILEYLTGGRYNADLEAFQKGANVRTGFNTLDQKIGGGLYAGLYVLGAVPTLGKTTYALQLADQIAEQHKHVLFFSMEQSRLELVTKSISRTGRKMNPGNQTNLKSSLQIRKGYTSNETETAVKYYKKNIAPYMNIIEGNFNTTADTIRATVDQYIKRNNERPVVIIDYLQILQPIKGSRATDPRTLTDQNITALKRLSRDCEVPVIAISSFNRNNYKQTVDYESFKETSGIEYTADVLLGMEYDIISALDGKNPNSDRDRVNQAKAAPEREIKLKCLKNRYGTANFEINMKYYPRFDYFTEDTNSTRNLFEDVPLAGKKAHV